jgi:hypothetical protein
MTPCEVLGCPVFAEPRRATCGIHRYARTAKQLDIARDVEGKGGKRCVNCGRQFAEADWCEQAPVLKTKRSRPGDPYGYRHVACEPVSRRVSRQAIREAEKPLFSEHEQE